MQSLHTEMCTFSIINGIKVGGGGGGGWGGGFGGGKRKGLGDIFFGFWGKCRFGGRGGLRAWF